MIEEKPIAAEHFTKRVALIKGADPQDERYVLGVVLEPDVVDAQNDIYDADEVRKAAHGFMSQFQTFGLMHQQPLEDHVEILESYLAPVDFDIADQTIRKGSWLLAIRVLSGELWEQVRNGTLTGFSIGGTARRLSESDLNTQEIA